MKIKGNVVVLTNGKLNTKSAKTAHGLIRGSKRFNVVAVIDSSFTNKFVHIKFISSKGGIRNDR